MAIQRVLQSILFTSMKRDKKLSMTDIVADHQLTNETDNNSVFL